MKTQFSLHYLFEYMTLCCMLAAMAGMLGIGSSVCLMLLGLALGARQGLLSLALLGAALAAPLPFGTGSDAAGQPLAMVVVTATCICGWYRWRAQGVTSSER